MNLTLILRNSDDDLSATEFKEADGYKAEDAIVDKMKYVKLAVWLVVFVSILVLYFTNDWLVGQNTCAKLWV